MAFYVNTGSVEGGGSAIPELYGPIQAARYDHIALVVVSACLDANFKSSGILRLDYVPLRKMLIHTHQLGVDIPLPDAAIKT